MTSFSNIFSLKTLFVFVFLLYSFANLQAQILIDFESISTAESIDTWMTIKPEMALSVEDVMGRSASAGTTSFGIIMDVVDEIGMNHQKYQQYHFGYPVEDALIFFHLEAGQVKTINHSLATNLTSPIPTIQYTEASALTNLLGLIGANTYAWESAEEDLLKEIKEDSTVTYYPKGKMVWVDKTGYGDYYLTYKFDVYAVQPLSRKYYYVDVQNGNIIKTIEGIYGHCFDHSLSVNKENTCHAETESRIEKDEFFPFSSFIDVPATGISNYVESNNSIVNFTTDEHNGQYILRASQLGDSNNQVVYTRNYNNQFSHSGATDFTNLTNHWTNDPTAVDVHWGTIKTLEYYQEHHNRNGFDDNGTAIVNGVHWKDSLSNAQWLGEGVVGYGDGNGRTTSSFTSLDIVAHEITHGVIEHSANLRYQNESGALNESFSDIFGVLVEFALHPDSANWQIGEKFDLTTSGGFRNMANPNLKNHPKYYGGQYWYSGNADNGGVHTNSGVQNYWFYLLVKGGTITNENGDTYTITPISLEDAAKIVYRNLVFELIASHNYLDARIGALMAAKDLFGKDSPQYTAVATAWCAVGVGMCSTASCPPVSMVITKETSTTSFGIDWAAISNAREYEVRYRLVNSTIWNTEITTNTKLQLTEFIAGATYEYAVRARCLDGTWTDYSSTEHITLSNLGPCEESITTSNSIVSPGTYQTKNWIYSDGVINSGDVVFKAASQITLGSGFEASFLGDSGNFLATIEDCEATSCRVRDSLVLVDFYYSTGGQNWTYNHNWLSSKPLSEWYGVTTNASGCVEKLELNSNGLTGAIPSELGNLSNLLKISLSSNDINGIIPVTLGNLSNLTVLHLGYNSLDGAIPLELGSLSNLTELFLSGNQLTGTIPSILGNLSNLIILTLGSNSLDGAIPSELGNLSNLTELWLPYNQLSGAIPPELGNLTNLEILFLADNNLDDSIPSELGNLSNLTKLWLDENNLTGTIPSELENLSNLTQLRLENNDLTGSIPRELGNLLNLQRLYLSYNQLSGAIPPELGNLVNLKYLSLYNNQLTDSIPSTLGNLINLEYLLVLSHNNLTGSIPSELGNLLNLQLLYLNNNQLSGAIPSELGDLLNLQLLYLDNNQLNGAIPIELRQLNALTKLRLNNNNLSDCFPLSISSLCDIDYDFSNNPNLPGGGDFATFCSNRTGRCSNIRPPETGTRATSLKTNTLKQPSTITLSISPNPVNRIGTISYFLPTSSKVFLEIYTVDGQLIKTLEKGCSQETGKHEINFSSRALSKGTYILKLQTKYEVTTQKMVLLE